MEKIRRLFSLANLQKENAEEDIRKKRVYFLINLIFLLSFSIFLSLGTNFSPMNNNIISHDSGIFSYIAFAMHQGKALYREAWENKGPLLYIIYYIGQAINNRYGVYILELISIFISTLFGYKTIKLVTEKRGYSILGIIYTFSVWGATFEGGTFSESFALPILFIGVYLFTKKILKNEKTSNIEIIIWGILVGIISLLRLNMLSIFLGFFVIIGINLVLKKEFKEIFRWIGFGILGFCITIMPIVIYLIKSNALIDCLNSAYFNIMSGFNSGTVEHKIRNLINMFLEFNESQAFILILSFTITSMVLIIAKKITKKEYKLYIYGIILTIIINSYANSIAGAHQMHYMLTFIPILAMCIALSIKVFDKIQLLYLHKLIVVVVVVIGGYLSYLGYNQYIHTCKIRKNVDYQSTIAGFMEQYVRYVASPDECIQIIGGRAEATGTNYRAQRLAASKYSYLPLWTSFTKERKQEMTSKLIEDIKNNRPKIIMICKYGEYLMEFNESIIDKEDWQNFINDNYIEQDILPKYYIVYVKKP